MAEFDESKVISALHPEKAEVGKEYWFADSIVYLKNSVECDFDNSFVLGDIVNGNYPFVEEGKDRYRQFIYPYEEPLEQRMTNRQLAEWLAKGNGEQSIEGMDGVFTATGFTKHDEYNKVPSDYVIRRWDSDEWIAPTVDIYERDCK